MGPIPISEITMTGVGDGGDDVINSGTGDDQNTGDNLFGGGDGGDDVINSGDGNDLNRGDNLEW